MAETLIVNTLLLGVFAIQHSVMARPAFKRWWTRYVPAPIERSTYVLLASSALILLFAQWRPITHVVWSVPDSAAATVLAVVFWIGWAIVLASTFMIDHLELFGLRQVFARLVGRAMPRPEFRTPLFYRHVRHPIYLGFLLAFWATPVMTAGHLLFAPGDHRVHSGRHQAGGARSHRAVRRRLPPVSRAGGHADSLALRSIEVVPG